MLCPTCGNWAGSFADTLQTGHHALCPRHPNNLKVILMSDEPTLAQKILAKKGVKLPPQTITDTLDRDPLATGVPMTPAKPQKAAQAKKEGDRSPQAKHGPGKGKKAKTILKSTDVVRYQCGHERSVSEMNNIPCHACRKLRGNGLEKHERRMGRLPHGASFGTRYDGEEELWEAILSIDGEDKRFRGTHSSLHTLLADLGRQWHEYAAQNGGTL